MGRVPLLIDVSLAQQPVSLRTPLTVLAKQFQFELDFADPGPRYNIAPTQDVAAVRIADGKRELAMLHWGLIPVWAKDKIAWW